MTTAEGPRLRAGAIAEIEGLTLALRRDGRHHEVLRGVDLSIQPGEILGLVGESAPERACWR